MRMIDRKRMDEHVPRAEVHASTRRHGIRGEISVGEKRSLGFAGGSRRVKKGAPSSNRSWRSAKALACDGNASPDFPARSSRVRPFWPCPPDACFRRFADDERRFRIPDEVVHFRCRIGRVEWQKYRFPAGRRPKRVRAFNALGNLHRDPVAGANRMMRKAHWQCGRKRPVIS